jgi:hypothetical protein
MPGKGVQYANPSQGTLMRQTKFGLNFSRYSSLFIGSDSSMNNDSADQPLQISLQTSEVMGHLRKYKDGMAGWAEPQLEGKDLLALGNGGRFLVAVRKLATDQYAVVDLDHRRFKVLGNVREAIEEYHGRIAWLGLEEWDNKFFEQKELNVRLAHWHSHVRRYLCEQTDTWIKEERGKRVSIILGILALLILPLSFYGFDLRLGIALGVIGTAWSWLRIKM